MNNNDIHWINKSEDFLKWVDVSNEPLLLYEEDADMFLQFYENRKYELGYSDDGSLFRKDNLGRKGTIIKFSIDDILYEFSEYCKKQINKGVFRSEYSRHLQSVDGIWYIVRLGRKYIELMEKQGFDTKTIPASKIVSLAREMKEGLSSVSEICDYERKYSFPEPEKRDIRCHLPARDEIIGYIKGFGEIYARFCMQGEAYAKGLSKKSAALFEDYKSTFEKFYEDEFYDLPEADAFENVKMEAYVFMRKSGKDLEYIQQFIDFTDSKVDEAEKLYLERKDEIPFDGEIKTMVDVLTKFELLEVKEAKMAIYAAMRAAGEKVAVVDMLTEFSNTELLEAEFKALNLS